MNKIQRLLLSLLAIIIIASSCSSKFSVSKRRYMKGFHVSVAINAKAKKSKVEADFQNEVVAQSLDKIIIKDKTAPLAFVDQKEKALTTKTTFNTLPKQKKVISSSVFNDRYASLANKAVSKNNIVNTLIERREKLNHNSVKAKQKVKAPFDSMGWGGIGPVLAYVFGSILATVLLYGLLFLFIAAFSGAVIPVWLIGFLIAIGVFIVIAIIVVVVINGD